jgi:hypothetical protein
MRSLTTILAALIALAFPIAASGDNTVAYAPTTTGQTLGVWFDSPQSDEIQYARTTGDVRGIASLYGDSAQPTSIARVVVGYGDGYEAPGSTYVGDPSNSAPFWNADGLFSFQGTRTIYVTAIAEDGTRATATVTFTIDPKWRTSIHSYGVLHDPAFPDSPPALRARLEYGGSWNLLPLAGQQVIFYVKTERVCDAVTNTNGLATCSNLGAVSKAVAEGDGYTAVFRETDSFHRATDWGVAYYPRETL